MSTDYNPYAAPDAALDPRDQRFENYSDDPFHDLPGPLRDEIKRLNGQAMTLAIVGGLSFTIFPLLMIITAIWGMGLNKQFQELVFRYAPLADPKGALPAGWTPRDTWLRGKEDPEFKEIMKFDQMRKLVKAMTIISWVMFGLYILFILVLVGIFAFALAAA